VGLHSFQHDRLVSLLNSLLVPTLRPLEENSQARAYFLKSAPVLQFFVVELLSRLFDFEEDSLRVCRETYIWETLYSSAYFSWGLTDASTDRKKFAAALRDVVFRLTVMAGSLAKNAVNVEQLQQLLEVLRAYGENDELVFRAADSIFTLLNARGPETRQSLVHGDSFKIMVPVLERYCSVELSGQQPADPAGARDFALARAALLGTLDLFLGDSEEGHLYIFEERASLNFLFHHLVNPVPRVRALCLKHLLGIVQAVAVAQVDGAKRVPIARATALVTQVLDHLPRDFASGPSGVIAFEVLVEMIRSLQKMLVQIHADLQRVLAPLDAPERLISISTAVCSLGEAERRVFATEVLRFLTALVAGSAQAKENFHRGCDFAQVTEALVALRLPWDADLVATVFGLLVDGEFNAETRYAIFHPEALEVVFRLYPVLSPTLRSHLLDLIILALPSYFNRMQFCDRGHFLTFCRLLADPAADSAAISRLVNIIRLLGNFSVSAADYHGLLGLLKATPGATTLTPYYGPLLAAAAKMPGPLWEPQVFFQFFGIDSRLAVKCEKWANHGGFSFFTWLRVESYYRGSSTGRISYKPRLLSIADTEQGLLEFFVSNGTLHVSASARGTPAQVVELTKCKPDPERWQFLCITYSRKKGGAEVVVYLDGTQQRFPGKLDTHLAHTALSFSIGAPVGQRTERVVHQTVQIALWGQLSSIYLFDDILSVTQVQGIRELGPNYTSQFLPEDVDYAAQTAELFDGGLQRRLVINFNPKSSSGGTCLDLAHPTHTRPVRGQLHDVSCAVTHRLANTVHTQGGLSSLFPLITQSDLPQAGEERFPLALLTLQLFRALLVDHAENQRDLASE